MTAQTQRSSAGSADEARRFLSRSAVEVAPELLGAVITHRTGEGVVSVRLTEVEAYIGDGADPGSHAFRGKTRRNAVMYGPPGHLYAYFTYGMHVCANIVTSPAGEASGVLLRAGEVVEGRALARSRRRTSRDDTDLARGPARLCVALGIALSDNGTDLFDGDSDGEGDGESEGVSGGLLRLRLPGGVLPAAEIGVGPRTGVSGAGGSGESFPWRFWVLGDATVSPYRAHVPRKRT